MKKDIADSLSSADAIIDAARRKNLKLMVGHIERFNPAILKLKERLFTCKFFFLRMRRSDELIRDLIIICNHFLKRNKIF